MPASKTRATISRELALFLGLLFLGFAIVPIVIYLVGQQLFGEFGGLGYADFFGALSGKVRRGEPDAWFCILAPYLIWQTLRLTILGWRRTSGTAQGRSGPQSPNL